uniref:NADH-ubiquinone oxidoreductase chain 6 n=1 Tax=Phloeotribus sp. BMNH 1047247 TaxID=1903799 RepID=A0A343A5I0_9CUCU|nr:NADH dehydrogenase subunit 6 [Phloeotribus sp. BMNH 1047247]
MLMYFLNSFFSFMSIFMMHPLSLGFILLIQSILISLMSGFFYYNFWYSYILFLIMVSSLLVMFIYMTSIASNEKFNMPKKKTFIGLSMIFLLILIMIFIDHFYFFSQTLYPNLNQELMFNSFSLAKFYNFPNSKTLMMIMIYLLLTLIVVVKIVDKMPGPLRQK